MSALILTHVNTPEALSAIEPENLHAVLEPDRTYLSTRAVEVPSPDNGGIVNYTALLSVLENPDEQMPAALAEAFLLIDELSKAQDLVALLEIAQQAGLPIATAGRSPADVVAQLWLRDRELLRHARGHLSIRDRRRVVSFRGAGRGDGFAAPAASVLRAIEADLDTWFAEHGRGRGCRVHAFQRAGELSIAIRHGHRIEHLRTMRDGKSEMLLYRPERYDLVIYRPGADELRVHADTEGVERLYRETLGVYLFGSRHYFSGEDKYNLEPLRIHGEQALNWHDVEGIEWVKLHELAYTWDTYGDEVVARRSKDILRKLFERGKRVHHEATLVRATFIVKIRGLRRARIVNIRGTNVAEYTQDVHAAVIDRWLAKREFARGRAA
jgi:hypothetical protein